MAGISAEARVVVDGEVVPGTWGGADTVDTWWSTVYPLRVPEVACLPARVPEVACLPAQDG